MGSQSLRLPVHRLISRIVGCALRWHSEQSQSINGATVHDVFLHDLGNVRGAYLRVPDSIRINHHRGANSTETNGCAFRQHDTAFGILTLLFLAKKYPSSQQFAFERCPNFGALNSGTRFSSTNKNVMANGSRGDWRQLRYPFTIIYWIQVCHTQNHRETTNEAYASTN